MDILVRIKFNRITERRNERGNPDSHRDLIVAQQLSTKYKELLEKLKQ